MTGPRDWDPDRVAGPDATDWADTVRRGARIFGTMLRSAGDRLRIATTPKREIWRDGKVSLHRYAGAPDAPLGPLLIVHGLFGRQTIVDLEPERSLVRRLLAGGTDLWILDWGNPSRADSFLDMADYALGWLGDACEVVESETGRVPALFGICQGGVFALCLAARAPDRVAGLALAVTPVDFHADVIAAKATGGEPGLLNTWARGLPPATLDAFLAERGVIPGETTGALFQGLSPVRAAQKYGPDLLAIADDAEALETFLRMELWLADRPDHPGAAARQWILELYGENRLALGQFELDGRPVDLGRIACPVLNIVARDDHIVPPACARALERLTASRDYRLLEVPTGHIGVFVSEKAREIVAPGLLDWLDRLAPGQSSAAVPSAPPGRSGLGSGMRGR